jgi:hypothetical protein
MLNIVIDLVYISSKFLITSTYSGIKYMIYGNPNDLLLIKLNQLEQKLIKPKLQQTVKDRYISGTWLVILNGKILLDTTDKPTALKFIAKSLETSTNKYLLIQVDDDSTACEL